MKRSNKITTIALMIFLTTTGLFAQSKTNATINDKAIENLKAGIVSVNLGLKKDCLYLAGKYKLNEAVPVIIEELKSTRDCGVKILAARVLYEIGNRAGLDAVRDVAIVDTTGKVKRICAAIYNAYAAETVSGYYAKSY